MRNFYRILTILSITVWVFPQFNINSATHEELQKLPLAQDKIDTIEEYLFVHGNFTSIYDILRVEGISSVDIQTIKSYIIVEEPEITEYLNNQKRSSYKIERWLSAEGNTEGLSEIWLDRYFEPENINEMNYDDLISLPNLSPIDVTAVLKQKKRGEIKGTFELKNSPGISHWGYKNLVDFIDFSSNENQVSEVHFRFNNLFRTVPITTNPDDEGQINAFADASRPEIFRKLSLVYGNHVKLGYVFHNNMGEPQGIFTEKRSISFEKIPLGNFRLDRLVIGNFTTSFGQGVIMETSDYFSPRRTGFGFTKRTEGIHQDLTRSSQYVMDGFAIQMSNSIIRGAFFASIHPRDAIINNDGEAYDDTNGNGVLDSIPSFSSLIVMQPRLPWGASGNSTKIFHEITSSVTELTWGGNIRISPAIGTNIGFTFYESLYDRRLIPQVINTITGGEDDDIPELDANDYDNYSGDAYYNAYMTNSADPEIAAMYSSAGTSPIWQKALSFRRVRGFDFSTVLWNLAIQGEYGELSNDNKVLNFGNDPHALVLNIYTQFDNLNFLALYRDYDLEFDNPYQRSYSNYQRYKTTIFEDSNWLEDPIYSYLYSGNPQPQAEKGIFISSRYQFHRSAVGVLNWDTWTRKADNAKYFRTVVTIDWRPVFNYRINIRQKWQARGDHDIQHPSPFQSRETRIRARLRLSSFDQVELLYSRGYTTFSPRPRLTDNAIIGADMMVGDIGSPDETIGISFIHNFDNHFKIKGGSILISGFLWYLEDTDFRMFNSEAGAIHNWVSFNFRPTPIFSLNFKVSHTLDYPMTRVTEAQAEQGYWVRNPLVNNQHTDFRIQLDYAM